MANRQRAKSTSGCASNSDNVHVFLLLLLLCLPSACSRTSLPDAGQKDIDIPDPDWLKSEPLILAGGWDSMPIFRRRVGGGTEWQEEDYRRELSEQTAKSLKDLGVTLAVIQFFKASA